MTGLLRDRWGDLRLWVWIFVIIIVSASGICGFIVVCNIAWNEGVETTVTGTIVLHKLKYDKFWKYNYTDVEMRTYSGDTHHVQLIDHIQMEHEVTYRIRYVIVNYWAHLCTVNNLIEIERLD